MDDITPCLSLLQKVSRRKSEQHRDGPEHYVTINHVTQQLNPKRQIPVSCDKTT